MRKGNLHRPEPALGAIFARGAADFTTKQGGEGSEAFVAALEANFGNGEIGFAQESLGPVETHPDEKPVRRSSKSGPKEAQKMKGGHAGFAGERFDAERFGRTLADQPARVEEPSMGFHQTR